jgi:signal transduction histidine kinase
VRVDGSDNRQRYGTGLGLSIARQIVTQLDGEIGFQAAPGGGTIFKVFLRKIGTASVGTRASRTAT